MRERMKSGLSTSAVYKGLCDLNIYDKIEKGKYTGDIHLIRLVLQRLGISASIAGKYLCRDEYDEMLSRFNILEFIKEGRLDTVYLIFSFRNMCKPELRNSTETWRSH